MNPAGRNAIPGKSKSSLGIHECFRQRRKITGQPGGVGYRRGTRNGLPDAEPPILRIKVCSFANQASGIAAKEVVFERRNGRFGWIEKISGIEPVVAVEIVNVSVKCSIARRKRVVVAGGIAKFRGKV